MTTKSTGDLLKRCQGKGDEMIDKIAAIALILFCAAWVYAFWRLMGWFINCGCVT